MSAITLELGIGRQSIADLCDMLNMPPPVAESNHNAHVRENVGLVASTSTEEMEQAAKRLRHNTIDAEITDAPDDVIVDVAVSVHRTWCKQGHTANFGITLALVC